MGSDCKNGNQLYKAIQKTIPLLNDDKVQLIKDDNADSLKKYNIKNKPGLIIDNKIVCEGKVLNERELFRLLKFAHS